MTDEIIQQLNKENTRFDFMTTNKPICDYNEHQKK